jgi:hypothetical protein
MVAQPGHLWKDQLGPLLRKTPHDAMSVEMRDALPFDQRGSLAAPALFDQAISEFRNSGNQYRMCDFGLPALNAGLTALDRYMQGHRQ